MSCTDICTYHHKLTTISNHGSLEELQTNTNDEAFLRRIAIKYAKINQRISAVESRLLTIILERNLRLRSEKTNDNKIMRTFSTTVMHSLDTLTELNRKLRTIIGVNLNSSSSSVIESKSNRYNDAVTMAYQYIVKYSIQSFNNFQDNNWTKQFDSILWLVIILFVLICFD